MAILIGFVIAATVLWLWLSGHWFGRVLAFLAFGTVFGVFLFLAFSDGKGGGPGLLGFVCGQGIAWVLAGIPIWRQRWLDAAAAEAIAARKRELLSGPTATKPAY